MRNTVVTLALWIGLAALPSPAAAQAPGDSLRLTVDGMVCSLCAYGVEHRLGKLDQVEQVNVNLDSGLVVVLLKRGAAVSDSTLTEEVRRAGFALRGVQRFKRESASESR
ncbi:MAG: heavy-metal-associated domain-containing protein [Gemmatimonadales bacterium]